MPGLWPGSCGAGEVYVREGRRGGGLTQREEVGVSDLLFEQLWKHASENVSEAFVYARFQGRGRGSRRRL